MKAPWHREDNGDLERLLVSARAVPREELVERLLGQIGYVAPEQAVPDRRSPVLRRRRRMALAGVLSVSMLVFLAAFGGVGFATTSSSKVGHSVYHAVSGHYNNNSGKSGNTYSSSNHSAAAYHENPHPGYFCGTKGSTHQLKLILTQQRYDRLIKSGWKFAGGPFSSASEARHRYPNTVWGNDDGRD